jgi:hypothetical protein
MKHKNWIGTEQHRLSVIEKVPSKWKSALWRCRCACGREVIVSTVSLKQGQKSCGCWKKDHIPNIKHLGGKLHPREYKTWKEMRQRCYNKTNSHYRWYGGKGISICERWSDFRLFYEDMGDRPPGRSIHRKDNSKGYSPENCKWATAKEQASNNGGCFQKGMNPHNKGFIFLSPVKIKEMRRLREERMTYQAIADRYGISIATSYKYSNMSDKILVHKGGLRTYEKKSGVSGNH